MQMQSGRDIARSAQYVSEVPVLLLVLVLTHVGHEGHLCTATGGDLAHVSLHLWHEPFS